MNPTPHFSAIFRACSESWGSLTMMAVGFSRRIRRKMAAAQDGSRHRVRPVLRTTQGSMTAKMSPCGTVPTERMRGSRLGGYRIGICLL